MTYTTEDIAKAGRTTLRGVRLWDANGLFGEVERDRIGARVFTEEHRQKAWGIQVLQMAGKSLEEIGAIMGGEGWRGAVIKDAGDIRKFLSDVPGVDL